MFFIRNTRAHIPVLTPGPHTDLLRQPSGEGFGKDSSDAHERVWCLQSSCHSHAWLSHCPGTVLCFWWQLSMSKTNNTPIPPPDPKEMIILGCLTSTYRRWRNKCIQHQFPKQNPCHQHFLRLKAIKEGGGRKVFLIEINSAVEVIITELITDLKQNPKTLRFCECRWWVLFSLHIPCEQLDSDALNTERAGPLYTAVQAGLLCNQDAIHVACDGSAGRSGHRRGQGTRFLSQPQAYTSLAGVVWAQLSSSGSLECHDFVRCVTWWFYWLSHLSSTLYAPSPMPVL